MNSVLNNLADLSTYISVHILSCIINLNFAVMKFYCGVVIALALMALLADARSVGVEEMKNYVQEESK